VLGMVVFFGQLAAEVKAGAVLRGRAMGARPLVRGLPPMKFLASVTA